MVRALNLGLRFLLELAALGAVASWGVHTGGSILAKVALGLALPIAFAVLWGTFVSPKAAVKLSRPAWFAVQAVLFGAAALALVDVWSVTAGIAFAVIVVVNTTMLEARN